MSAPTLLSPLVRRLTREHGVDLARITGTGLHGRITARDLRAFLEARSNPQPVAAAAGPRPGQALVEAEPASADGGVLAQVCVAVAAALRRHPGIAGGDRLAVAAPGGPVAVVADAHMLVADAVARRLRAVAGDPAGGFPITDCTGSRVLLLPPVPEGQVAALTVGRVRRRPVVVATGGGEAVAVRDTVPLALAWDPRVITDADAVAFLAAVTGRLEQHERAILRVEDPR